jgi:two-component system LytT family response regulator
MEALGEGRLTYVVFVTAFDQYAVQAFEVNAVDYLLKPFGPDRFEQSLSRAKARLGSSQPDEFDRRLRRALAEVRPSPSPLERLLVPSGQKQVLLDVSSIDWIEAEQNYVRLHVGTASFLVRTTLSGLEERLDRRRFIRIHRSRIINAERVREIHPWSHGDQMIVLRDGTELILSRRYRDRWADLTP